MGLKIESVVEEKITSTISKLGFEIEYVEYVKEANNYILRIVLDKPSGTVDVDECEKVSRAVEDIIDTIIKNEYVLEVSSPGIERQLRNIRLYKKYVGSEIYIKLFKKIEYGKELVGILKDVDEENNNITLKTCDFEVVINLDEITSAHTVYDFSNDLKGSKPVNLNKLNKFNKK